MFQDVPSGVCCQVCVSSFYLFQVHYPKYLGADLVLNLCRSEIGKDELSVLFLKEGRMS